MVRISYRNKYAREGVLSSAFAERRNDGEIRGCDLIHSRLVRNARENLSDRQRARAAAFDNKTRYIVSVIMASGGRRRIKLKNAAKRPDE